MRAVADAQSPVDAALRRFAAQTPVLPLAVAFSGGADSTALLLACHDRWPGQVHAWHVHHGLQTAADDFETHCVAVCERLNVPLIVARVDARAGHGESPEAVARAHRYATFDALAREQTISTVAIAQHADDQVETVLLALLRGSGVAGLAAMPGRWQRGGVTFWRPLLDVPKAAIRDWLRAREQGWVEDPMNVDEHYTRGRIRARLIPTLEAAFPAFRTTFARSSRHAAQAQELLTELAALDLAACGVPPRIADLRNLRVARRANVLRHWLAAEHGQTPTGAQLDALLAQLAACATRGHRIRLKAGQGFVIRAGDVLQWSADG